MADRYVVTMTNPETTIVYDGMADNPLSALIACVRINGNVPPGDYVAEIGIYGQKPKSPTVSIGKGGAIFIGARWGLPTPTEPIDRADLGVDVGVLATPGIPWTLEEIERMIASVGAA